MTLFQYTGLDVVIQFELSWVRTKSNIVNLFLTLKCDPGINEVLGKHSTTSEEVMILL